MIKLDRVRTHRTVPGGLRGTWRRKKNQALLELKRSKGSLSSADFKATWWKPAKDQLKAESHGKCAYCEAHTMVVAHGDVEHFRPKSVYWWLAYCYDNYLFVCQICDQIYKSNHFPRSGPKMRGPVIQARTRDERIEALGDTLTPDPIDTLAGYTFAEFQQDCLAEAAALIDPYMVDPEPWLKFDASVPGEVKIVPVDATDRARVVFEALDRDLGLNREELRKLRGQHFKILDRYHVLLRSDALSADERHEVEEGIREFMAPEFPFAGMVRYFVHEWGLAI